MEMMMLLQTLSVLVETLNAVVFRLHSFTLCVRLNVSISLTHSFTRSLLCAVSLWSIEFILMAKTQFVAKWLNEFLKYMIVITASWNHRPKKKVVVDWHPYICK